MKGRIVKSPRKVAPTPRGVRGKMAASAGADASSSGVIALRHAISVLRCFSVEEPLLGVNEVARRVGLHKSSVSRIASTLEETRLVERDPITGRLRLGVGLITLAAPLLANLHTSDVMRPLLEDVARESGETVSLNMWDGLHAISIMQAVGASAVAHYAPPGMRNPAHCTAAGKALLAYAPDADWQAVLAHGLFRHTERTITTGGALRDEISKSRQRGYFINRGEFAVDVGAVAAIVRDVNGHVVAAVTATVPMYRFDKTRQGKLGAVIAAAARTLSARLGNRSQ